ncbi:hypothetical protein K431DRAFT_287396 [Polychaeton citri CBS 116435]|uniref:Putative phospholipase n=1 Tax=Polychaeton citri CBS 116435 TaxID=1314669 RepID=A0A9P4Q5D8_9PEZI|nr:hypothetical protein K431DRAFT_287396 [Polychaeton citri CBS 116435]
MPFLNGFPAYHGPYSVGTVDVELPTADLPQAADPPLDASATIAFRIFYPCTPLAAKHQERPVHWIQNPQHESLSALFNFLSGHERVSSWSSMLLRHLRWIQIPAHRNAKLLEPPSGNLNRWPVTVFSHGLAGSRNAYSYICGDLASFGTIVIAPDHRDGSSPIQHVRATEQSEAHTVEPRKYPHVPEAATWKGRDAQLRIRLFEIATIFEALVQIDAGQVSRNLDENYGRNRKKPVEVLQQFRGKLDVHGPGSVTWAGHSFGAATTVQLLKSSYYASERPPTEALLAPSANACITSQITPRSPTLLLDPWCLPFISPDQEWLQNRPLPSYAKSGPNGANVLVVLSEAFFIWSPNLDATKHIVAPPTEASSCPGLGPEGQTAYLPKHARLRRDESPNDSGYASEASVTPQRSQSPNKQLAQGPHFFYTMRSKHLNQSDFGILFPWLTKWSMGAEEPERVLELNVRAMAQTMRNAGIPMGSQDDPEILDTGSSIRRWTPVQLDLSPELRDVRLEKDKIELGKQPTYDAPVASISA